MDKYQFEEKVSQTRYLVEADSFAKLSLWERWAEDSRSPRPDWVTPLSWKQHNMGTTLQLGELDGRPVMLTLFWDTIGGVLVCFYDSGSQVTDYRMVEDFLDKTFPGIRKSDAMNFGNVILDIQETAPQKEPEFPEAKLLLGREAVELYRKEGAVNTRAVEMAQVAAERGEEGAQEVYEAVQTLETECERFREGIWMSWLKQYYRNATYKGHEGTAGPVTVLVYGLAGRVMVTIRFTVPDPGEEDWFLSFLGYDDEGVSGMYVRGAQGNVRALVNLAEVCFRCREELRTSMHVANEVGLAI